MFIIGMNVLGNLNKTATSVANLGLPLWRVVIAGGILSSIFGGANILAVSLSVCHAIFPMLISHRLSYLATGSKASPPAWSVLAAQKPLNLPTHTRNLSSSLTTKKHPPSTPSKNLPQIHADHFVSTSRIFAHRSFRNQCLLIRRGRVPSSHRYRDQIRLSIQRWDRWKRWSLVISLAGGLILLVSIALLRVDSKSEWLHREGGRLFIYHSVIWTLSMIDETKILTFCGNITCDLCVWNYGRLWCTCGYPTTAPELLITSNHYSGKVALHLRIMSLKIHAHRIQ